MVGKKMFEHPPHVVAGAVIQLCEPVIALDITTDPSQHHAPYQSSWSMSRRRTSRTTRPLPRETMRQMRATNNAAAADFAGTPSVTVHTQQR